MPVTVASSLNEPFSGILPTPDPELSRRWRSNQRRDSLNTESVSTIVSFLRIMRKAPACVRPFFWFRVEDEVPFSEEVDSRCISIHIRPRWVVRGCTGRFYLSLKTRRNPGSEGFLMAFCVAGPGSVQVRGTPTLTLPSQIQEWIDPSGSAPYARRWNTSPCRLSAGRSSACHSADSSAGQNEGEALANACPRTSQASTHHQLHLSCTGIEGLAGDKRKIWAHVEIKANAGMLLVAAPPRFLT